MARNSSFPYTIYTYPTEIPVWSQVLLAIFCCTLALLLFTCLAMCCLRLCGCWTGNIFGYGAVKRPVEETDHVGCWCCGAQSMRSARITDDTGSYVIQMRRDRR